MKARAMKARVESRALKFYFSVRGMGIPARLCARQVDQPKEEGMKKLLFALTGLVLASCSMMPAQAPVALKDGELSIPANYKTWPKFLSEIQRPDAKQVREI